MKPIRLKIAGLNSFRERQDIDFSQLSETGVFGIFGQTGSGKSTILDAITLALYGTVERAANNTQGILNHAEDQVSVEYVFSLAAGSQRVTYRAERAYRRSGDRTVKASTCRLVEISNGVETVLASKADEMTRKIEDILGLTVDDFTRAVVLPQGKFAEFLTIKPKDRRQMLERLFALEAYGRDLAAKLTEDLRRTEFDLNGVEQRQQGLGDASAERVKAAEKDFHAAAAAVTRISQELTHLKQHYDDAKVVWGLQEQLQQVQDKEAQLATVRPQIDGMMEQLSLAERAEALRPLLEEISLAEEKSKTAKLQAEDADLQLKEARSAKEIAEKKWTEASQQRLAVEPRCLRRLEQLEQAKGLEEEIQGRQGRLADLRSKYSEQDRKKKEQEQKLIELAAKKEAAQKKQQEIKTQLAQMTVDPAERIKVNAAAQALAAYQMVSKQVGSLQSDLEKNTLALQNINVEIQAAERETQAAQAAVDQLKAMLKDRQEHPPVREETLSERAQTLERYRHVIVNIERTEREWAEEQTRWIQVSEERNKAQAEVNQKQKEREAISEAVQQALLRVEQYTEQLKRLEQSDLAGRLVDGLKEGAPCPVCGSLHHPNPAPHFDQAGLEERNGLEEATRELQSLEVKRTEIEKTLAVTEAQLSTRQEQEQNQLRLIETKKAAILLAREALLEADRDQDLGVLTQKRAELELNLEKDRSAFTQWKIEHEQMSQRFESAQRGLAEKIERQHKAQAQMASVEGGEKELCQRLNQAFEEQVQRQNQLDTVRGEIAVSDIERLQKQFAAWDQAAQALNQDLTKREADLQTFDEVEQGLLHEKNDAELELQTLKTVGSEAAREITELKTKCDALTEGKAAIEQIEHVQHELTTVTETEEKSKHHYELAKTNWIQAEQTQAVRQKAFELAAEGMALSRNKLEQGLKTAQFMTVAAAQSALCDAGERMQLEQDIKAFQQEVLLLGQKHQDILTELNGRRIRPEEWLAWPIRLKEAEKTHIEALEHRGAAFTMLEKLNEQHTEWMRLEHEKQSLSHRFGLLKTLQTVFKGNAFVEFIAQEQLTNVTLDASERLKQLTNHRYALEVDSEGGFIMRDDANGGVRRPVSSLSGGETFLTSLALALALSTQIQLRGESPLEFFFLDEGFGTLDANLLETVMNTLEKLHLQNLTIGIISHVPELKNRLARRLIVTPAEAGGAGSKVKLELA